MDAAGVLSDTLGRVREGVPRVCAGLDAAALEYRPTPGANSIAWLVWHLTRVQDDHVADLAGRAQVWIDGGWFERFALPFDPEETGYGFTAEQVGQVRGVGAQLLIDYHEAVSAATQEFLTTVTEPDLDRVVDTSWDPPVTMGVRFVSLLCDDLEHLGQAAYLRGLVERAAPASAQPSS